ncbi:hypothetical protein FF38_06222 [Lucilia cuprina]|uniref:Uncharacterized protein n=1 Tax=Lucilia cuprina TaxID=7375 RepID=A0A0L0CEZ2_LUCCU|nr:hypothetical protein FF38_06222 [Lucilia cuprina]
MTCPITVLGQLPKVKSRSASAEVGMRSIVMLDEQGVSFPVFYRLYLSACVVSKRLRKSYQEDDKIFYWSTFCFSSRFCDGSLSCPLSQRLPYDSSLSGFLLSNIGFSPTLPFFHKTFSNSEDLGFIFTPLNSEENVDQTFIGLVCKEDVEGIKLSSSDCSLYIFISIS